MGHAARIENALLYTLESGARTGDFGDRSKPALNTTQFIETIIGNLGKTPAHGARTVLEDKPITPTLYKLEKNPLIMSQELIEEKIVGADFFVESDEQPTVVADKILAGLNEKFELVTISNRGTQVWPKGSVFTNLVNQYRCRIESKGATPCSQDEILELYRVMMQAFKVCSIEILNMWGEKKGYSLAQGQ